MTPALFSRLLALRAGSVPAALVTRLSDGAQCLVHAGVTEGELALDGGRMALVATMQKRDASGCLDDDHFVRVYNPPLRLILVGAVHIAQALVPMARIAGFEPVVVDPRTAFASAMRFPGACLVTEWPGPALAGLQLDRRSAVITLTHDPKLDEPALVEALKSEAFFIGSLGSRKTQASRLERLRALGISGAALSRIQGPVGLPLGGRRPAEIAVSILAAVIQALHRDSRGEGTRAAPA